MTLSNPAEVKNLDSQYVSYEELIREELLLMGVLFEKLDHKELNHLDFGSFQHNAVKHCWKELQELHAARAKGRWSCPGMNCTANQ